MASREDPAPPEKERKRPCRETDHCHHRDRKENKKKEVQLAWEEEEEAKDD